MRSTRRQYCITALVILWYRYNMIEVNDVQPKCAVRNDPLPKSIHTLHLYVQACSSYSRIKVFTNIFTVLVMLLVPPLTLV